MVARAVLALLGLDRLIVHVHVVLDGRHILMPQQFLEAKGVIAQHQVADGEGMAEDVRADALAGDARSFTDALEEQRDPFLVSGRRVSERNRWSSPVLPHSASSSSSGR